MTTLESSPLHAVGGQPQGHIILPGPEPLRSTYVPVAIHQLEQKANISNRGFIPIVGQTQEQAQTQPSTSHDSITEANDFFRKQEIERLVRFDEALKSNDQEALARMSREVREGAFATRDFSEYDYLSAKYEAHKSGRPLDVVLRERAYNRAAKAGDEGSIRSILAQAENKAEERGDYKELNDLIDRNNRRSGEQYLANVRKKRVATFEAALRNNDPENRQAVSDMLDQAYSRGQDTGDYSEYNDLAGRYSGAKPEEFYAASRRVQALQNAVNAGDANTVNRILQGVQEFGTAHELRRLKEFLPSASQPQNQNEVQAQPKSNERRRGWNHRRLGIVLRKIGKSLLSVS
ncbi:MAG TPA: hypothetical protein VFB59_03750 [Candidatus Saccharimonadales bacterium]|nr:hypothetical protein [Candidatus Saccharimonadales bacterium]